MTDDRELCRQMVGLLWRVGSLVTRRPFAAGQIDEDHFEALGRRFSMAYTEVMSFEPLYPLVWTARGDGWCFTLAQDVTSEDGFRAMIRNREGMERDFVVLSLLDPHPDQA